MPASLYRGEKRSGRRQNTKGSITITWKTPDSTAVGGKLLDASRRGFLCELSLAELGGEIPVAGQALDFSMAERPVRERFGMLRKPWIKTAGRYSGWVLKPG